MKRFQAHFSVVLACIIILSLFGASSSLAREQITNGAFDGDLSGWTKSATPVTPG